MTVWSNLPSEGLLYLRPLGFVSHAEKTRHILPLAGGPRGFSLVQIIVSDLGERVCSEIVPVGEVGEAVSALPDKLRNRAEQQLGVLQATRPALDAAVDFQAPRIMGVLNVTPDSFSDGGKFVETDAAIAHGVAMVEAGADIIDIGGESTRPGAKPIWEGEELDRVLPVITALAGRGVPLSIDTRRAAVMEAALEAGAGIINDVSALAYDDDSLSVAAKSSVPVVLMHARGEPATMQDDPSYEDVLLDVYDYLEARILACAAVGIDRGRLIVDPGIGFGKSLRHNLDLINGLGLLQALGCPVLLGVSRKRFIGALSREEAADQRLPGSLAAMASGLASGANIVRVHDVAETKQALAVIQGLSDAAFMRP